MWSSGITVSPDMANFQPITLVVQCPNGRRQSVKTTRNCCILQVLEAACAKQQLNPCDFDLRHYNKPLDLSLPIYFANLANNALLELYPTREVREERLVTVGLQIESGERYTKDFVPSSTIWDVVEQCLALKTDDSKLAEEGDEPFCIYMRQKLEGEALKTTTLHSLGLTKGTAIVRLIYRKPRVLDNQAHITAPLSKPSLVEPEPSAEQKSFTESKTSFAEAKSSSVEPMTVSEGEDLARPLSPAYEDCVRRKQARIEIDTNNKDITTHNCSYPEWGQNSNTLQQTCGVQSVGVTLSANEECAMPLVEANSQLSCLNTAEPFCNKMEKISADESMDMENYQMDQDVTWKEIGPIHYIGERHAVLYSLEDITDVEKDDLPDDFYDVTVYDVKYLMEEYKKNRIEMESQPLLTRDQRNRRAIQNLAYYRQTVIRVVFPEKLVLQAVFDVEEKVHAVCEFLRNFLEDKHLYYYLYTTPPKNMLNPSEALLELKLVPAAKIYFGCDFQYPTYLMPDLRNQITDPRAASLAASESRKQSLSDFPLEVDLPEIETSSLEQNVVDGAVPSTSFRKNISDSKPLPKWFKLSKK